jgi:hypothetical protein
MAFKGKHTVRSKIMIDGSILEQFKQFNYRGYELNINGEPHLEKINRVQGICNTTRRYLKEPGLTPKYIFIKYQLCHRCSTEMKPG